MRFIILNAFNLSTSRFGTLGACVDHCSVGRNLCPHRLSVEKYKNKQPLIIAVMSDYNKSDTAE
jgi:hypothetical protein